MKKKYFHLTIILLIIISLAAFGRVVGNDFINFDDNRYITHNSYVRSDFNYKIIKGIFTSPVSSNWVPLTIISHSIDWKIFGANASGHHFVSLLLHIGAALFLFLFLNKTTNNLWPSAFAAALFALHPLRVESVAWASERKDVLSMFFGMATLYAYAFYVNNLNLSRYFFCLILFALSLLSKSMLVTLPFVLLLLDYWPLGRWQKEVTAKNKNKFLNILIGEKIPFIFLTIIFSIITFLIQDKTGFVYPYSIFRRFANAIQVYAAYLGKTFWPVNLTLNYFFVYSFTIWQIIFSFLIIICITITVIYFLKKGPFLFVGWFWYLGTLIPVIGLVPTNALLADHYTYLPSIGIAIMLAWGIPSLIKKKELRKNVLFPAAIFVFVVLVFLTWQQCGHWKNSIALFNHVLSLTKNNYLAHNNRGCAYEELGQYQHAIEDYNEAIRLKPDYVTAYNNRAMYYFLHGKNKEYCRDLQKLCELGLCVKLQFAKKKGICN